MILVTKDTDIPMLLRELYSLILSRKSSPYFPAEGSKKKKHQKIKHLAFNRYYSVNINSEKSTLKIQYEDGQWDQNESHVTNATNETAFSEEQHVEIHRIQWVRTASSYWH